MPPICGGWAEMAATSFPAEPRHDLDRRRRPAAGDFLAQSPRRHRKPRGLALVAVVERRQRSGGEAADCLEVRLPQLPRHRLVESAAQRAVAGALALTRGPAAEQQAVQVE